MELSREYPVALIEMLARKVLEAKKLLTEKEELTRGRKLNTREKELIIHISFATILKDYAKKEDHSDLKRLIGKKMSSWKNDRILKEQTLISAKISELDDEENRKSFTLIAVEEIHEFEEHEFCQEMLERARIIGRIEISEDGDIIPLIDGEDDFTKEQE
jgi:hypothetical protein